MSHKGSSRESRGWADQRGCALSKGNSCHSFSPSGPCFDQFPPYKWNQYILRVLERDGSTVLEKKEGQRSEKADGRLPCKVGAQRQSSHSGLSLPNLSQPLCDHWGSFMDGALLENGYSICCFVFRNVWQLCLKRALKGRLVGSVGRACDS